MVATSDAVARVRYVSLLTTEWPEGPLLRRANSGALCPVEVCLNWTEQEVQRGRERAVMSHERPFEWLLAYEFSVS